HVYVIWRDHKDLAFGEVYFIKSDDNGETWSKEKRLSVNDGYESDPTAISANGSKVIVVWMDEKDSYPYSGAYEIYYRVSKDYGNIWLPEVRLTYAVNESYHPDVAIKDGYWHIVWYDNRTGGDEIYYKRHPGW
ncbi:hypothetical protein DRJ19_04340, partial [Candidatus Woesearchaeota archaeon]